MTKRMSDSEDEPCMLLKDLDVLMRFEYPQKRVQSPRPSETLEEPTIEYDHDDECDFITVSLDCNGIPLSTNNTFTELSDDVVSRMDEEPPLSKFESSKKRKKPHTQITVTWNELPREMREKFTPLLKMNNKNGYTNVHPQPGTGGGFQVQAWSSVTRKHTRLGTVKCERVGAIMVAAAELDPSLSSERLVCRDWFIRMVSDNTFRSEWMVQH